MHPITYCLFSCQRRKFQRLESLYSFSWCQHLNSPGFEYFGKQPDKISYHTFISIMEADILIINIKGQDVTIHTVNPIHKLFRNKRVALPVFLRKTQFKILAKVYMS